MVGIGLIEPTESSDLFNYKSLFKFYILYFIYTNYCILYFTRILIVYICMEQNSFFKKLSRILHFFSFGLGWYLVLKVLFLVLFLKVYRELEIIWLHQIWFFGNSNKDSPLRNVCQYIFLTSCNTLHSENSMCSIHNKDYRIDVPLCIVKEKPMKEKENVK